MNSQLFEVLDPHAQDKELLRKVIDNIPREYATLFPAVSSLRILKVEGPEVLGVNAINVYYDLTSELTLYFSYFYQRLSAEKHYFAVVITSKGTGKTRIEIFIVGEPPVNFNVHTILTLITGVGNYPASHVPEISFLLSEFNLSLKKDHGDFVRYESSDAKIVISYDPCLTAIHYLSLPSDKTD